MAGSDDQNACIRNACHWPRFMGPVHRVGFLLVPKLIVSPLAVNFTGGALMASVECHWVQICQPRLVSDGKSLGKSVYQEYQPSVPSESCV